MKICGKNVQTLANFSELYTRLTEDVIREREESDEWIDFVWSPDNGMVMLLKLKPAEFIYVYDLMVKAGDERDSDKTRGFRVTGGAFCLAINGYAEQARLWFAYSKENFVDSCKGGEKVMRELEQRLEEILKDVQLQPISGGVQFTLSMFLKAVFGQLL